MQWRNTRLNYGAVGKTLHWLVVLLIIVQYALGWYGDSLPQGLEQLVIMARHKSFGITILLLAAVRLAWRWANPVPELPPRMPRWEQYAAQVSHFLLYALLFAMPITGWLTSSAANFSVSYFGLFTLPDMIAPDENIEHLLEETHETLAWVLLIVIITHVLAALRHHFWLKDNVLRRMLPGRAG